MSEPLELLGDVLEVRCRLDQSQRTVDGERVEVCPDDVVVVGLGRASNERGPHLRRWLPGVQRMERVPELFSRGALLDPVEVGPALGRHRAGDPVCERPAQVVNDAGVGESDAQHLVRQLLEDERLALETRAVGVQWQIRTTSSPISHTSFESFGSGIGASIVRLAASATSRSRAPESTSHDLRPTRRPADEKGRTRAHDQRSSTRGHGGERRVASGIRDVGVGSITFCVVEDSRASSGSSSTWPVGTPDRAAGDTM
jgi:hypothetical protein